MGAKDKLLIIGRGKAGWHAEGITSDGNKFFSSGGSFEGYLKEATDGTVVYDADDAPYDSFARWVFSGPMVSPALEPGTVQPFGENDKRAMLGMLPALEGGFKDLALATMAGITSLDYVATDVYIAMMRERVPGVRFGTVKEGSVQWEPFVLTSPTEGDKPTA